MSDSERSDREASTAAAPVNTRLKGIRGLEAWIEVDGKELDIYRASKDMKARESTDTIVAQNGKRFTVHIKTTKLYRKSKPTQYRELGTDLFIDGEYRAGSMTDYAASKRNRLVIDMKSILKKQGEEADMIFAAPVMSEAAPRIHREQAAKFGKIDIMVVRCRSNGEAVAEEIEFAEHWTLNERDHKANVSSIVQFRPTKPNSNMDVYMTTVHPKDEDKGFFTFRFAYQTREVLIAKGLIPDPEAPNREDSALASNAHPGEVAEPIHIDLEAPPPEPSEDSDWDSESDQEAGKTGNWMGHDAREATPEEPSISQKDPLQIANKDRERVRELELTQARLEAAETEAAFLRARENKARLEAEAREARMQGEIDRLKAETSAAAHLPVLASATPLQLGTDRPDSPASSSRIDLKRKRSVGDRSSKNVKREVKIEEGASGEEHAKAEKIFERRAKRRIEKLGAEIDLTED